MQDIVLTKQRHLDSDQHDRSGCEYLNWQNSGKFRLSKAWQKMHRWKCGSQNESQIKAVCFAAASLFNSGMRLLAQSNKGITTPQKRHRLNPASSLFKDNYMPALGSDSFSSAGKLQRMSVSLASSSFHHHLSRGTGCKSTIRTQRLPQQPGFDLFQSNLIRESTLCTKNTNKRVWEIWTPCYMDNFH